MSEATSGGPTVRFGRLPQRGVILGLSGAQVVVLAAAAVLATASLYTGGGRAFLVVAPAWAGLTLVGLGSARGRALVAWLPLLAHWRARQATGQTRYRARPSRPHLAGLLGLPGDAAALRVLTGPASGMAVVHDVHAATITAVVAVSAPAFVLADRAAQERRVAGYGRLLAGLCQHGVVSRVQLLERSVPESGGALARWWTEHGITNGTWAARIVADLVADAGPVAERHETYLAIAVEARRHRDLRRALGALEQEVGRLGEAVRAADLHTDGALDPGALRALLRTAYDPAAARSGPPGAGAPGPMAVEEDWAHLRTDSAWHAVYWISEWPRSEVSAAFLQPLVLLPRVRHALSIVAEPRPAVRALRDIRRAKVEHAADEAQRRRAGQVEDEAARMEAADVVNRELELAAGHGDLAFAGLLAVSAACEEELESACARAEQAAAQASCELRRLVGQQAQAFTAAALPLARGLG